MTGPLTAVRFALAGQARSTVEIARHTGLPGDLVAAVVDHLIRNGELAAEPLASGCTGQACGACALSAHGCAAVPARGVARASARRLTRLGSPAVVGPDGNLMA